MSCRPGVFTFPRHYVRETVDWIRAFRPSVVKAFAWSTSGRRRPQEGPW